MVRSIFDLSPPVMPYDRMVLLLVPAKIDLACCSAVTIAF